MPTQYILVCIIYFCSRRWAKKLTKANWSLSFLIAARTQESRVTGQWFPTAEKRLTFHMRSAEQARPNTWSILNCWTYSMLNKQETKIAARAPELYMGHVVGHIQTSNESLKRKINTTVSEKRLWGFQSSSPWEAVFVWAIKMSWVICFRVSAKLWVVKSNSP